MSVAAAMLVAVALIIGVAAAGCGDGDGDGGDTTPGVGPQATATAAAEGTATPWPSALPTGIPGTPGNSPQEPLDFPATRQYDPLELSVDRWELVECLPPEVTPTAEGEECPQQSLAGKIVRFFATVRNTSTTESASGRFDFAVITNGTVYAVFSRDIEDAFPATTESLGPGEAIEGWVYSFRPSPAFLDSGKVRIQATIGPTLEPEVAFWWRVPLP